MTLWSLVRDGYVLALRALRRQPSTLLMWLLLAAALDMALDLSEQGLADPAHATWLSIAALAAYCGLGATTVRALLAPHARPLPASLAPLAKLLALHLLLGLLSLEVALWPGARGGRWLTSPGIAWLVILWVLVVHLAWTRWLMPTAVALSLGDARVTPRDGARLMRGYTVRTLVAGVLAGAPPLLLGYLGYAFLDVGAPDAQAQLAAQALSSLGGPVATLIANAVAVRVVLQIDPGRYAQATPGV